MSLRTVYGNDHSENGWPMVDEGSCNWVTVPGTNPPVNIEIQQGWPTAILRAWVADHNAYVEPVRDADTACWTATNAVASSNHLSGTAVDVDWSSHPFQVSYAGFNDAQIATIREMLDFYEGTVFWGQDWDSPKDPMHVQCGGDTFNNPHTGDFIARKIRADGFSTFRRDNVPVPPPPPLPPPPASNAVDVLARATGVSPAKAAEILPTVIDGLRLSQCTNVNRVAMWLAQMGHESASFVYTEEIQSGDESTDRWLYKGRTWIQITWKANYADFSAWLFGKGLISSPTYFVDHPKELADQKWAGIGPAWYWTVQRSDINTLSDAKDIELVSRRINGTNPDTGRANGIDDRINRWNRALALGDQLLALTTDAPPTQGEGFLMALSDDEQHEVLDLLRWLAAPGTGEFRKKFSSRSAVREPNEGPVDSITGMNLNTDGNVDFMAELERAKLNYPPAIERLKRVAAGTEPGRTAYDALLAQAMLAAPKAIAAAVVNDNAPQPAAPAAPQVVYVDRPVAAPTPPPAPALPAVVDQPAPVTDKSMGDVVKTIVDAVEQLKLADALTIQDRATLAASIKILEMKNGASL